MTRTKREIDRDRTAKPAEPDPEQDKDQDQEFDGTHQDFAELHTPGKLNKPIGEI